MTEKTKTALLEFLRGILAALVALVTTLIAGSCGTTRAVVTNRAEQTTTTIRITTANPTSVSIPVSADVELQNSKLNE